MSWWKLWQRGGRSPTPIPEILPPLAPRPPRAPTIQPEPATSRGPHGVPATGRPQVFDPALKHFPLGVQPGDPPFEDPQQLAAWRKQQRQVMAHVLRSIADSPAAPSLVLRGSALMCAWFGELARPPKDLDFVVVPDTLGIEDRRAVELLEAVVTAVVSRPCPWARLDREDVARDPIWTYDRVPGTRLVFHWAADGMPWGATQLDFVFGERLPVASEALNVALDAGAPARLQTAPQDLSLAWKLLWLHSDMHPRGKDLYDAMLLAESTPLPQSLLDAVFQIAGSEPVRAEELPHFSSSALEWIGFEPHDEASVETWNARLARALRGANRGADA